MNQSQRFDLTNKVAIITGASKGIGEAIAYSYGKAGAKVVISSRKLEAVEEVARKFRAEGIEVLALACHMGDMKQIETLIEKTVEIYGGVDIVVNNAVTNPIFGPVLQADLNAFDKMMAVNVKGPMYLCQLAQPLMRKRGGGSIINISSVAGLSPEQGLGIYSVTKASLNMMTKVMAKEWGSENIRVNAICPGVIKTKFSQALTDNEYISKELLKQQPIQHFGEPNHVADTALLLASEAGSYFTGSMVTVDGGLTI
ncbi:MAG: glucose 1-dehydrogenase [Bacteroidetes bacterium]|nr:MAG: glucose 1-dehydrogenase [Bacteroidota bacterium]TAG88146.1 MAG: glucose 1-dehydrogenase [Bacteroidota bacterium]